MLTIKTPEINVSQLGKGIVDSVAYDTAVGLSIQELDPKFARFGRWLRKSQHADGHWGTSLPYFHDQFICTLQALVSLRELNDPQDQQRIAQGQKALGFILQQLKRQPNSISDTIGYPLLATQLLCKAAKLDLDVPQELPIPWEVIQKKLRSFQSSSHTWRNNTITFSLEAVIDDVRIEHIDFLDGNGSVGNSPAATAALLHHFPYDQEPMLTYLKDVVRPDGGLPTVTHIDVFEIVWALEHLRVAGAVSPDEPQVQQALDRLEAIWTPTGIGHSSFASFQDLDDTAAAFSILQWGGRAPNPDVFALYEEDDHFRCFQGEANISLSAHIRTLLALRDSTHPEAGRWISKILNVLSQQTQVAWFDKWHVSPFYLTPITVRALKGLDDTLARAQIAWIKQQQHADGGWGYYGSTAEETAYCLELLLFWDRTTHDHVDNSQLRAAANYLSSHADELPALWIGKCLYTPRQVVQAAIYGALHSYEEFMR